VIAQPNRGALSLSGPAHAHTTSAAHQGGAAAPSIPSSADLEAFNSALESARTNLSRSPVTERVVDGKRVVWAPQPGSQEDFMSCPLFEVLIHGTRGGGKDLAVYTRVLTDRGWVRADEVTYDHRLVALDGTYTNVVGIYPKRDRRMYTVTFHDGATVTADAEHRWLTFNGKTGYRESGWIVRTTEDLARFSAPMSVPFMQGPVGGTTWAGPDPYMVGLLLGDGTMRSARVTLYSADEEILQHAASLGWNRYKYEGQVGRACCPEREAAQWRSILPPAISHDKRVPEALLTADPAARLAVLQGLMDTDGSVDPGGKCRFDSTSEGLARDLHDLAWSLGGTASVTRQERAVVSRGGHIMWRVSIRANNKFCPFRLSRKAARVTKQTKFLTRGIKSVKPTNNGDGVCFAVDHPSHCFVIQDWVVTHNTDTLLMTFAQHVGKGYGAAWRGIIFRQTYPQLADVVAKSERWFRQVFPGARFNRGKMAWEFEGGEMLMLRHMRNPDDYWSYHGHEYPFIGWEELTNWANDVCYRRMISCCRSSTPGVPHMIRSTTNPYGRGHDWVKQRFRLHGRWWETIVVVDSRNELGDLEPARCAIHSHVRENKVLLAADPSYLQNVVAAAENQAMAEAWARGSWAFVAGGMFSDVWSMSHNALPRFRIPASWRLTRAFDWGSAKPFSVGWYAIGDGSDLLLSNGKRMATVRGDLFRVREWYGFTGRANEGLKMLANDVAAGIVEREIAWGWRTRNACAVKNGVADSAIFAVEDGNCIATNMAKPVRLKDGSIHMGVQWNPSDKGAGSRKNGWELMRQRIKAVQPRPGVPREEPGLFVVAEECPQFLRTVLSLTRDEKNLDDIDTDAEDHIADEVRYMVRSLGRAVAQGGTRGMF
jgi:hypothetical protein